MEKIYGKCMTKNKSSTNGTQIIESAALLKLQQQKREELQKRMTESDDKCNLSRMSDSLGSPFKVGGRHFRHKVYIIRPKKNNVSFLGHCHIKFNNAAEINLICCIVKVNNSVLSLNVKTHHKIIYLPAELHVFKIVTWLHL